MGRGGREVIVINFNASDDQSKFSILNYYCTIKVFCRESFLVWKRFIVPYSYKYNAKISPTTIKLFFVSFDSYLEKNDLSRMTKNTIYATGGIRQMSKGMRRKKINS